MRPRLGLVARGPASGAGAPPRGAEGDRGCWAPGTVRHPVDSAENSVSFVVSDRRHRPLPPAGLSPKPLLTAKSISGEKKMGKDGFCLLLLLKSARPAMSMTFGVVA